VIPASPLFGWHGRTVRTSVASSKGHSLRTGQTKPFIRDGGRIDKTVLVSQPSHRSRSPNMENVATKGDATYIFSFKVIHFSHRFCQPVTIRRTVSLSTSGADYTLMVNVQEGRTCVFLYLFHWPPCFLLDRRHTQTVSDVEDFSCLWCFCC